MKTLYENEFYALNIYNNKYYRYDKILKTNMLLNRLAFIEMIKTINNNK